MPDNAMRKRLLFITLCLSILRVYSTDVKFHSINSIFGISMRETSSICKDKNGFIWTSSKTGILRITDSDYRIYQLPYKTANIVTVKLLYANSELYAYSNNGQLFVYNSIFDRFDFLTDFKIVFKNNYLLVHKFIVHKDGSFWVATSSGLFRIKNSKVSKIGRKLDGVRNIEVIDANQLICESDIGISILNTSTLSTTVIHKISNGNPLNTSVFFHDKKKNRVWIGTQSDGLYFFDIKSNILKKNTVNYFPKQPILAIEVNSDSTLLVGVDGQGIWELTRNGNKVLNVFKENVDDPTSLHGDGVYDILCDENKRIWVATYSGGLSFYDQITPLVNQIKHKINSQNSLSNNSINKILEDKRGNLWFATDNGISHWNLTSNKWSTFYQSTYEQSQVFLALGEDIEGNIWAGTYSSGVYVLDGVSGRELMHFSNKNQNSQFSGKFIFDIFRDSQGDMWLGGMQSDIICYNSKTKKFRNYTEQPVKSIAEFSPGKILLACTYGLILLDKEKGDVEYLSQNYIVQDILVLGNDIWFATCGDGLIQYNYKDRTKKQYTTETGLLSNFVNSIILSNGFLWLGTENGLCRIQPKDKIVDTYSSISQLSNLSFNVGANYLRRNGELIFGTNSGAINFNPNTLYKNKLKGHIYIQDIKLSGRSIRENVKLMNGTPVNNRLEIKLQHNQNTVEVELLPIGVTSAGYKFSWKMEGLDREWSSLSKRKIITYTNLPSGSYDLKIKMYDSSLTQVVDERTIHIHIIPPFWKAWWFRLFLFVSLLYIAYFSLKYYTNKLKQRHTEDKIRFFTTTAHEIRTSLTLISAPIEELNNEKSLTEKGNYYLNLAREQTARLLFVATQLLDFQKVDIGKGQIFWVMVDVVKLAQRRISMFETAAKKTGLQLEFKTNQESYFSAIDELKIEKVIDNLISNAIKYSRPNGKIEIVLHTDNEKWTIEVKDFGLGISENAQKKLFREFYRGDNVINSKIVGSGIGLLLVKNYVSMHNGVVTLKSKENEGTVFKITIPYKEVNEISMAEPEEATQQVIKTSSDIDLSEMTKSDSLTEKKLQLLIVEDNNDLQEFLKKTFEQQYKISTANDGQQAWDIIQKKIPDLVISDVMMPKMDGFELCKLIKSSFDTSHIPVVLLTALGEKGKQLEGLGLGANDYITKPFDVSLLKQRIMTIIKNRDIVRDKALKLIKQTDIEQPILSNEHNDQFVKKALKVVRENMANCEFDKDEFASTMNASPSLLYKKIKSLTGQSPVDFIKFIRLDYSLELLQSHKYSVTEISELCGFSSVGYFSTVFKKHFGKSPTEI